jgi:uncharacterized protein YggU (UPF0235/DUF167 family)
VVATDDGRHWLSLRLAALPSDGAANDALIGLLARELGVRKADIALASGATSRLKRLHIAGHPERLDAALERLIGQ